MKTSRPIIKLQKTKLDSILEWGYFLISLSTVGLIAFYYNLMPVEIPSHIGLGGKIDRYGDKISIWLLPCLQLVIGFIGYHLLKRPHKFNYLTKITPENAEKEYRNGVMILRVVFIMSALLIAIVSAIFIRLAIS